MLTERDTLHGLPGPVVRPAGIAEAMHPITLPKFRLPLPSMGCNPLREAAGSAMWAWAEQFGLCASMTVRRRMERTQAELWCALTDPGAGLEELTLRCQWTFWAFVVDDEFDDDGAGQVPAQTREAIGDLLGTLHGTRPPTGPATLALADLWERTRAGRSPGWQRVFRADTTAWLWTYYREAVERAAGQVPAVEDYLLHRRDSIGMGMFLDLFEAPPRIDLPGHARQLPGLRALRHAVMDHVALYNDICSAQKEGAVGYYHNAVFVLRHHRGGSVQDAVEKVESMRVACAERAIRAERQLAAQLAAVAVSDPVRAALRRYTEHHRTLLRGDFEYHARAQRYQPEPQPAA